MRLATDTGGTFTDLVVEDDDGAIKLFKASTVPSDPVAGVLAALKLAADDHGESLEAFLGRAEMFIHGTTHALNALVTNETAKTALIVTEGHRDILVLREGGRSEPFNNSEPYPKPFVPRALTLGVTERVLMDGSVRTPLSDQQVREIAIDLQAQGVEAIAVCLLWSIVNPEHELRIERIIREVAPEIAVTLSHRLNPTPREYRRACSAAIDASLKPIMTKYIAGLKSRLLDAGFNGRVLVLTSRGGMVDADVVAHSPIQVINSGPSVAPVAGRHYAGAEGSVDAIIADTGGTTYDVGLIRRGEIPITREVWLGRPMRGHLVGFPSVDMKSVGAGGGSIAWVDNGGLLHVGPKSAGAQPGPACYGRGGTLPTVSDAALVLGFVDPHYFLGGAITLDAAAARRAVDEHVATPLGISIEDAASAIIEIVTENMVQAIVDITVAQGVDPTQSVLIGGGGAAGLNSLYIARRLGVQSLLIPETGATLSAAGALLSDISAEYAQVCFSSTRSDDFAAVAETVEGLSAQCRSFADTYTPDARDRTINVLAEARYENQVWEIDVPLNGIDIASAEGIAAFRSAFDDRHASLFSVSDPASPVEIVAIRANVQSRMRGDRPFRLANEVPEERTRTRPVYFPGVGMTETPALLLSAIPEDQMFEGPAILESPFTTIVLDPSSKYVRRPSGSVVIYP